MTVKKKSTKPIEDKHADAIINKGGKTTAESETKVSDLSGSETRFTLRIPNAMVHKIDKSRKAMVGTVSRNQWILEAISNSLPKK